MSSDRPTVSVLMTAYNREPYIAQSIESVLGSTFGDLELVIVDDGSTDGSVDVARSFEASDARVRVHENPENLGDYANRNRAAELANGTYIKYVDSDDAIYPYGLQVMVESMLRYPDAGYGLSCRQSGDAPHPLLWSPREAYLANFGVYGQFGRAPGSAIIHRGAFEKVGGFSGAPLIGDYEFWFRIGRTYPLVTLPTELVWVREHAGQVQRTISEQEYDHRRTDVVKENLRHADCPLSPDEARAAWKTYCRQKRKQRLVKRLRKVARFAGL